ncbi:SpoIID/LytB domain-containing protein [Clostridium sp. E02]|uniref:SpoIID/LytB domain-containing protein n=1 Tax=Clostridium sp. E02 TaxID=2487134 RepID=UPI001FAAD0BF|nr:SpoIID/LytB domain-containing protein [Clostridium sp. E02]
MLKKAVLVCLLALLVPFVITLAWTGKVEEKGKIPMTSSGKRVILDRKGGESYLDVEEFLPGVVAKQIPVDYGTEALRAQAIIARTYIYGKMDGQDEIKESNLHMEYLEEKQMEKMWGSESFVTSYQAIEEAVRSTNRMVITYEGKLIDPLFHRASTGKTRTGDEIHPYLEGVESKKDVEAEGYVTVIPLKKDEFVKKINQISQEDLVTVDQIPQSIQIVERDESGYVKQIQIGTRVFTGEEVQYALLLPSASYGFEEYEGEIRAVCQGIGHGYGLSQYGAKCKAEQGWKAEKILSYFYKNIVLISE